MLGAMTTRTKILIGAAIACSAYIVMTHEGSAEIELTHASDGPRAQHAAAAGAIRKPTGVNGSMVHTVMNRVTPETEARSLFAPHSWYVAPPPPPPSTITVVQQAPPPPTAPPLPFSFMGSYHMSDATPVFYLIAGDRVLDVKVGDTLDNTYKVDGVQGGQLLFTYMPLKIQQSLAVGEVQ